MSTTSYEYYSKSVVPFVWIVAHCDYLENSYHQMSGLGDASETKMNLPFDVLDSIFSFLHPNSLVACSKAHPLFSRVAERHLYHHITSPWANPWASHPGYMLKPSKLSKLLSETPHIANYVRVLCIVLVDIRSWTYPTQEARRDLEEISLVLPKFSSLECIILNAPGCFALWDQLPQSFTVAIENSLHLPTLHRIHVRDLDFPLCILDNHPNINCFSLCGLPQIPDCSDGSNLQLTALSFSVTYRDDYPTSFLTWAKRHIFNLQSLKCNFFEGKILWLLEICSDTLNSLDLTLKATGKLSSCIFMSHLLT